MADTHGATMGLGSHTLQNDRTSVFSMSVNVINVIFRNKT